MISMETFIILIAFTAGACGMILLLASLAGHKIQLVRAYNMQQEAEKRKEKLKQQQSQYDPNQSAQQDPSEVIDVSGPVGA